MRNKYIKIILFILLLKYIWVEKVLTAWNANLKEKINSLLMVIKDCQTTQGKKTTTKTRAIIDDG